MRLGRASGCRSTAPLSVVRIALLLVTCAGALATPSPTQTEGDWALHGYDLAGQRASPLVQIDTATVVRLVPKVMAFGLPE